MTDLAALIDLQELNGLAMGSSLMIISSVGPPLSAFEAQYNVNG
jgi:hypothetical protein